MPNENPAPPTFFAEIATVIQALSLYGAAGIAAFGWAMGWLLGVPTAPWLPLWFCAALLIYNADRLRRDPADTLNLPLRTAASARLRTASAVTLSLAAFVLIGLPASRGEWTLLSCICAGSIISLGYSIPIFGFRWKDIPLVKSLFAPTIITISIFVLSLWHKKLSESLVSVLGSRIDLFPLRRFVIFLIPWAWTYLLFNMLLCDLRDLPGDAQCGIRSIPVLWGEKLTRRLLWAFAIDGQLFILYLIYIHLDNRLAFVLLSLITGLYQAYLLHATQRPRSERFYEWAVEGLLFLPALVVGLSILLLRLHGPFE